MSRTGMSRAASAVTISALTLAGWTAAVIAQESELATVPDAGSDIGAEPTADDMLYEPTDERLQEAIAYATKNARRPIDAFRREWFRRVGTGTNTVEFTLQTPFLNVAAEAREAALQYREYTLLQARTAALAVHGTFTVLAMFRAADRTDAAAQVMVLREGDRIVHGEARGAAHCSADDGALLCDRTFRFPRGEVPATTRRLDVVLVRGATGREAVAHFDLRHVR